MLCKGEGLEHSIGVGRDECAGRFRQAHHAHDLETEYGKNRICDSAEVTMECLNFEGSSINSTGHP